MSTIAYPEGNGVKVIISANTPEYTDIQGVLINPDISSDALNVPDSHREIVDGKVVKKSDVDIAALDTRTNKEKREAEYKAKCDPYLPILTAYKFTGDPRYDTIYAEWKALRDEIEAKYPRS